MHEAPLSEHILALRRLVIKLISILFIGMVPLFMWAEPIIHSIIKPIENLNDYKRIEFRLFENTSQTNKIYQLDENYNLISSTDGFFKDNELFLPPHAVAEFRVISKPNLALFSPSEGLVLCLKFALLSSLILLSPFWLMAVWQFVKPALHSHETRLFFPFVITSLTLMGLGALFAMQVTLPLTNSYFWAFNASLGVNLWGMSNYVDYWLNLMAGHLAAFELLAIALFLIKLEIIKGKHLKGKRRYAIVISLILGALLTPPDIISQLLLALPLMGLFELALFYANAKARAPKRGHFYRADQANLSTHWPK